MSRLRSVFNNFKEQDEECRVEVNLSEDGLDGDADTGGFRRFRPAPQELSRRNICNLLLATLLFFIIGYLAGYFFHSQPRVSPVCENNTVYRVEYKYPPVLPEEPKPSLSWDDITDLLKNKLTSEAFTKTLSEFDQASRLAGSAEDMTQGNKIFSQFKQLGMEPWTDIHYVRLQTPDKNKPNTVTFKSNVFRPQGFLAYSGTGKAQGKLVYANYGSPEDFAVLSKYVEVNGSVVMMKRGKINFAQKVANAEGKGAVAALIHPPYVYPDNEVFGHVHFGSGDPYTPGFPSFNQTMFPPTKSSGLPTIPAQTITPSMAKTILQTIGGPIHVEPSPSAESTGRFLGGVYDVTVEVNNVLVSTEIVNVFGVIKGFIDPDRYVVLGAQRDAWGKGYARATVGTAALIELAKAVREMVEKDGFRPRRSLVFASWSGGEYGSVGATEWLEAYMSSLDKSVFTYISLDGIVKGSGSFYASASPLLHTLLEKTLKAVRSPVGTGTVNDMIRTSLFRPMSVDDPAYPFLASYGIPSISFHFTRPDTEEYKSYNTRLDTKGELDSATAQQTSSITATAAQIAGQMALRLVHDHVVMFDVTRYKRLVYTNVARINNNIYERQKSGQLKDISVAWMTDAVGSFQRAANSIASDITNTDLMDLEACRLLNDRIMRIERALLSPYVSPAETPYSHLLFGQGPHTLAAIAEMEDVEQLHTWLALATWNLKSCANAMVGNIWDLDY